MHKRHHVLGEIKLKYLDGVNHNVGSNETHFRPMIILTWTNWWVLLLNQLSCTEYKGNSLDSTHKNTIKLADSCWVFRCERISCLVTAFHWKWYYNILQTLWLLFSFKIEMYFIHIWFITQKKKSKHFQFAIKMMFLIWI